MKRPLNICLVSREYPPETGWGGIGTYSYYLAQGLADRGHRVHVICQSLNGAREYEDGLVSVSRIVHPSIFPYKGKMKEFALRLEYSKGVHDKILQISKKHPIDIIEGPNLSAELFIHSLSRIAPIVTRLHTPYSEVVKFCDWEMTADRRLSCWLEDAVVSRSNLVTCSTVSHAELIADEVGVRKDRINIIPLGIPLPKINSDLREDSASPNVLFIGRLEKRKGVHILMKAIPLVLQEFPDTRFFIIGRDTLINVKSNQFDGGQDFSFKSLALKDLPQNYLDNVIFLGHLEAGQLGRYIKGCDIFVAPSLYESFGFVYLEAMAYSKPVIGCGVGGVPEVIRDNVTGVLVSPEDEESLAMTIIELLRDPGRRREMGMAARKEAEGHFTIERMAQETIEAYRKII